MFRKTVTKPLTRVYTSYYSGELYVNQLVHPTAKAAGGFRSVLRSPLRKEAPVAAPVDEQQPTAPDAAPKWDDAAAADIISVNEASDKALSTEKKLPARPYVPISELAQLELKGDYLIEAGMPDAALRFYGVAAKGYLIALHERPNHVIAAKILVKLGRAFRLTSRLESSEHNLRRALETLEGSTSPALEVICECLMELGLTMEARGSDAAGSAYEDVALVIAVYHNIGESHRFLKNITKLCRDFNLNNDKKFEYYSPFDYDRCFALADEALGHAERFYRAKADQAALVRVLEARAQLLDQKFFNMNEISGRIRTMRGRHTRSMRIHTNAPTLSELLRYTPTVHQVYRDYAMELTAPLGREGEVQPGINRRVVDDGSMRRRKNFYRGSEARAAGSVKKFYQDMQWE